MSRTAKRKKEKKIKGVRIFFFILISFLLYPVIIESIQEKKIKESPQEIQMPQIEENYQNTQEEVQIVEKEEIPQQFKGYRVIAKIQIPKIEVDTCILGDYSKEALYECVTKYWGGEPNQIGNFCIAGHNSKRKNMFTDLKKLEIGDTFTISDNEIGKITYKIYDIYKVEPTNVECLSQETGGKVEVTLITCTNDSSKRIIVKARKEEKF